MNTILFFGNSLTAGYGLQNPSLESMPALIEKKLQDDFYGYKVVNAGISGDTTRSALNRIDLLLGYDITIFVLELGANDLLRGIPAKETAQNLQLIIDKVLKRHSKAKLMLLGMEIPEYIAGQYAKDFSMVFSTTAKNNNMHFMPFLLDVVAGVKEFNLNDGLHPSAKGYKVIAENVWKLLKPIL